MFHHVYTSDSFSKYPDSETFSTTNEIFIVFTRARIFNKHVTHVSGFPCVQTRAIRPDSFIQRGGGHHRSTFSRWKFQPWPCQVAHSREIRGSWACHAAICSKTRQHVISRAPACRHVDRIGEPRHGTRTRYSGLTWRSGGSSSTRKFRDPRPSGVAQAISQQLEF